MAALSVTANAFAIVGLADLVFRHGRDLYELCERAQSASRSISRLLAELRVVTSIVAHTRIFVHDFESSLFALEDSLTLPHIKSILTLCGQEFEVLTANFVSTQAQASDGWTTQFLKCFKWALDEQSVEQSCQRLQRLSTSLTAALSLNGRQNDIAIRKDIASLTQKMEQHTLLLAASPSQQPQQHVLPKSKGQLVPDSRRIGDTRQRCIVQGRKQKRLPHRTVTTILTDEPKHIQQTQQVILLKPLQSLVFLNLVEHLDQTVELFEPLHETITMPLLFMKTTITAAFINLVAEGLLLVSDMNTQYIMLIVDHILARSYKVSANALKRASAHNEHYRASQQHLKNAVPPTPNSLGWKPATKLSSVCMPTNSPPKFNVFYADQEYSSQSAFGILSARIHVLKGFTGPSQLLAFQLSFVPWDRLCPVRLSVKFTSHRLVEAFNCIIVNPDNSMVDYMDFLEELSTESYPGEWDTFIEMCEEIYEEESDPGEWDTFIEMCEEVCEEV